MKAEKKVTPEAPEGKPQKRGRKSKPAPVVYINLSDTDHYVNIDNQNVSLECLAGWVKVMRSDIETIRAACEGGGFPHLKDLVSYEVEHIARGLATIMPKVRRPEINRGGYVS